MNSNQEKELRNRLILHLKGGQAFTPIDKLINKMDFDQLGIRPDGLPYSFYQLFYHIWYSQLDILEYCRNENYETPAWPDDYWPDHQKPSIKQHWQKLTSAYFDDRDTLCDIIQNSPKSILEPFPQNPDHNLLHQAQLVIEHTSYHTGQLYVIHRLLMKKQKENE